jgi:hypothetical protein
VCCRERCVDPGKPCCPCSEDIPAKEGEEVVKRARETMKIQKDNKIKYGQVRNQDPNELIPKKMDCSLFSQKAVGAVLLKELFEAKPKPQRLSTLVLDGSCYFRRLKPGEQARAGDLLAQPRDSGPPGSQHVGVALGGPNAGGTITGIAMGNSGASDTTTWGTNSEFPGGDQLHIYRPQQLKGKCTKHY